MPPEGTIISRCDPIADVTQRLYFGVIEVAAGNKYNLKVLTFDGRAAYEKQFDEVIDTWILTYDKLFYQERLSDNMITYVKLSLDG